MAKSFSTLALGAVLVASLATGCAAPQQRMVVDQLPPQNFNGPSMTPRAAESVAVAPRPQIVLPPPQVKAPSTIVPREWEPRVAANRWRWIVIHHSATPTGGAVAFDRMHKAKGWDELGYHFVIGNGTDTRDGQVEVGPRWPVQKHGAHTKTPDNQYNDFGIGICLVGNFDKTSPSSEEMKSVARLVSYLMKKYDIPASRVLGHGQAKPTDCPGRYLSVAEVRRRSVKALADAGETVPAEAAPPVASLLKPLPAGASH